MLIMGVLNLILFSYNIKIDMYRAIYGNEFLFILNGITGSIFILLFLRTSQFLAFKLHRKIYHYNISTTIVCVDIY